MNKIVVIICLIFLNASASYSQLQRHEFDVSLGLYSSNFLKAVDSEILMDAGLFNNVSKNIDGATTAAYFTYRYFPTFKWSIGVTIGLERVKGDIQINGSNDGRYYSDFFAGAFETDYRYLTKPHLQIYSGVGAGIVFHDCSNELYGDTAYSEEFNFIYQLNIIGIRAGGRFGVFLEGGYGYKGIAKVGFNIQL